MHVGCHRAGGFGDEAGDQSGWFAGAAGADWSCGGVGEAFVEYGGDVVGVTEPTRPDQAWEQGLDVVVVCFGSA